MFNKIRGNSNVSREPLYSIADIASLTGLTIKQVDYRIKKLGIQPINRGTRLSTTCLRGSLLYKKEVITLVRDF